MMRIPRLIAVLALVALGVAAIIYGGYDDSPGAQLIGVALFIGAVVLVVRSAMRSKKRT